MMDEVAERTETAAAREAALNAARELLAEHDRRLAALNALPWSTMTSKSLAVTCGLSDWSVWCDLKAPDWTTVGSIYGADTVEENENIAMRVVLAVNAHETLVSALRQAREHFAGTDAPLLATIEAALKQAEGERE